MKQRIGGLLALALGIVLITSGLSNASSGTVGSSIAGCGTISVGLATPGCPVGTITVTETTSPTPGAGDPTPPSGGWKVQVVSSCDDPTTGLVTNFTLAVPDGGHAVTHSLEIFTDTGDTTQCQYTLTEQAVTGFTAKFTPTSPVTIPNSVDFNFNENVALANTFVHTPPSTSAASTSAAPSSSTGPIADTGPRSQIKASLWFGIGLCVLGLVMVFGGSFRRRGQHG